MDEPTFSKFIQLLTSIPFITLITLSQRIFFFFFFAFNSQELKQSSQNNVQAVARCVAMSQLIFSLSAETTATAAECGHEEEQEMHGYSEAA